VFNKNGSGGGASSLTLAEVQYTCKGSTIDSEPLIFEIDNFKGTATITAVNATNNYVGARVYVNDALIGSTTSTNRSINVTPGKISVRAYKISNFQNTGLTVSITTT
jgi:hypothetical protein